MVRSTQRRILRLKTDRRTKLEGLCIGGSAVRNFTLKMGLMKLILSAKDIQ
jgi:hypothetical protein